MPSNILIIIGGAGLVTFLIRYLPLLLLHNKRLPWWVERLLFYLPLSILGALGTQSIFLREGKWDSGLSNFYLLGTLVSIFLGIKSKNLTIIILGGVGTVALCTFFDGMIS